jgi:hypothetical protein
MEVKMKNLNILLTIIVLVFSGCGGGGRGGSSSPTTQSSQANGVVQKGPFVFGSIVTVYKLENGIRTSQVATTQTTDNKGSFALSLPWSGVSEFEIIGTYLDETTGLYKNDGNLTAILDVENGSVSGVNINIFTHIAASQIRTMLQDNRTIEEAKVRSKEKIQEIFGVELDGDTQPEDLDLTDGVGEHSADNAQLLKISASILKSSNPKEVLEKLSQDLEDGSLDNEALGVYEEIKQKSDDIDLDAVSQILEEKTGTTTAPDSGDLTMIPFNHTLSFTPLYGVELNDSLISNTIVVPTNLSDVTLKITNGYYSINNLNKSDTQTTVNGGDTIKVYQTSANEYSSSTKTYLNLANVTVVFESITKSDPNSDDTIPNSVTIPIKINSELNTLVESEPFYISGLSENITTSISIENANFSINDGDFITNGDVKNGDKIIIQARANEQYGGVKIYPIIVGGEEFKFFVYTKLQDTTPDSFTLKTQYDMEINTTYITEPIVLSGYDGSLDILIENGEISADGGESWTSEGFNGLSAGSSILVKQSSALTYATKKVTTLSIGAMDVTLTTYTKALPTTTNIVPNPLDFQTLYNQSIDNDVVSEEIIISGLSGTSTMLYVPDGISFRVNDGAYTTSDKRVNNGDRVSIKLHTGVNYNTKYSTQIYYWDNISSHKLIGSFSVYTKTIDKTPDEITFTTMEDVNLSSWYETAEKTITGINQRVCGTLVDGEISINSGEWKTDNVCFENNDRFKLRQQSAISKDTIKDTILVVGAKEFQFSTKTKENFAPKFTKIFSSLGDNYKINENQIYTITQPINQFGYPFLADSIDGDELRYSLENAPSWLQIDSEHQALYGTPDINNSASPGTTLSFGNIVLKASDLEGLSDSFSFELVITLTNDAPVIETIPNLNGTLGARFSYTPTITDEENDTLEYVLQNKPDWLNVDNDTGEIYGIPTSSNVYPDIYLQVLDGKNTTDSNNFSITIPAIEDTTPEQFTFTDKTNVELSSEQISSVTITGINKEVNATIVGGEYTLSDISDKTITPVWIKNPYPISNNTTIYVRHTSSSEYNTAVDTTLSIGGVSDTFSSTTKKEETTTLLTPPIIMSGAYKTLDDAVFNYPFTDDEAWRDALTHVYIRTDYGATPILLENGSDYTLSEGNFALNIASSTKVALHTPIMGGGEIIFIADGYENNSILFDSFGDGQYGIKLQIAPANENNPITETNLDGSRVIMQLTNHLQFADNILNKNNFILNNAPSGVSIRSIDSYGNVDSAEMILDFNGTDFDENTTFSFTILATELNTNQEIYSNEINITAVVEEELPPLVPNLELTKNIISIVDNNGSNYIKLLGTNSVEDNTSWHHLSGFTPIQNGIHPSLVRHNDIFYIFYQNDSDNKIYANQYNLEGELLNSNAITLEDNESNSVTTVYNPIFFVDDNNSLVMFYIDSQVNTSNESYTDPTYCSSNVDGICAVQIRVAKKLPSSEVFDLKFLQDETIIYSDDFAPDNEFRLSDLYLSTINHEYQIFTQINYGVYTQMTNRLDYNLQGSFKQNTTYALGISANELKDDKKDVYFEANLSKVNYSIIDMTSGSKVDYILELGGDSINDIDFLELKVDSFVDAKNMFIYPNSSKDVEYTLEKNGRTFSSFDFNVSDDGFINYSLNNQDVTITSNTQTGTIYGDLTVNFSDGVSVNDRFKIKVLDENFRTYIEGRVMDHRIVFDGYIFLIENYPNAPRILKLNDYGEVLYDNTIDVITPTSYGNTYIAFNEQCTHRDYNAKMAMDDDENIYLYNWCEVFGGDNPRRYYYLVKVDSNDGLVDNFDIFNTQNEGTYVSNTFNAHHIFTKIADKDDGLYVEFDDNGTTVVKEINQQLIFSNSLLTEIPNTISPAITGTNEQKDTTTPCSEFYINNTLFMDQNDEFINEDFSYYKKNRTTLYDNPSIGLEQPCDLEFGNGLLMMDDVRPIAYPARDSNGQLVILPWDITVISVINKQ